MGFCRSIVSVDRNENRLWKPEWKPQGLCRRCRIDREPQPRYFLLRSLRSVFRELVRNANSTDDECDCTGAGGRRCSLNDDAIVCHRSDTAHRRRNRQVISAAIPAAIAHGQRGEGSGHNSIPFFTLTAIHCPSSEKDGPLPCEIFGV